MKQSIPVIFIINLFCATLWSEPLTVGVMPFANNSLAEKAALEPLCKGLADMMATGLSKIKALKMVERADLAKIIAEMGLSQSGLVDESSIKEAGKLLGADLLLIGSFNQGFGGEMRIDARLVKVETGETMKAEEVTGKKKKLFNMAKKLSFNIAADLDLKLSREEKKALDNPDNEDMDALMLFAGGLDAEDRGDWKAAGEMYRKALSINGKYARAQERLKTAESRPESKP